MAGTTGLEPATSAVTGQRSNQLSYVPKMFLNNLAKHHIESRRFAAFAIFARFYLFVALDSISDLFGHQTIQRNDKIKSTRFGVRGPVLTKTKSESNLLRRVGLISSPLHFVRVVIRCNTANPVHQTQRIFDRQQSTTESFRMTRPSLSRLAKMLREHLL
jgi:hypothetical protein